MAVGFFSPRPRLSGTYRAVSGADGVAADATTCPVAVAPPFGVRQFGGFRDPRQAGLASRREGAHRSNRAGSATR